MVRNQGSELNQGGQAWKVIKQSEGSEGMARGAIRMFDGWMSASQSSLSRRRLRSRRVEVVQVGPSAFRI
jgi:hypothetical protein